MDSANWLRPDQLHNYSNAFGGFCTPVIHTTFDTIQRLFPCLQWNIVMFALCTDAGQSGNELESKEIADITGFCPPLSDNEVSQCRQKWNKKTTTTHHFILVLSKKEQKFHLFSVMLHHRSHSWKWWTTHQKTSIMWGRIYTGNYMLAEPRNN